jgi:hypothetical protein
MKKKDQLLLTIRSKTVEEAEFLLINGRFTTAVNRIYYGMFYILSALALKHQLKTSKHQQLKWGGKPWHMRLISMPDPQTFFNLLQSRFIAL